jgi:hypothetical protein
MLSSLADRVGLARNTTARISGRASSRTTPGQPLITKRTYIGAEDEPGSAL